MLGSDSKADDAMSYAYFTFVHLTATYSGFAFPGANLNPFPTKIGKTLARAMR